MGIGRRGVIAAVVALSVLPISSLASAAGSSTTTAPTTTPTTAPSGPAPTPTTAPTPTASSSTTTTTVAPSTTAVTATTSPRPTRRPTAPRPQRPTRGVPVQVTPTLPPPPPPEWELPADSGTGRRLVYSNSRMRVWAVDEKGDVVKTHRVSGKRFVPNPGTYDVFSKSLHTYSRTNPSIRWMYMVRFAHSASGDNIGFHEIPTQCNSSGQCWKLQTEAQLGQALSGGCVRQSTPDAIWVYNWADVGTTVVVLP